MGTIWQFFGFPDPETPVPESSKKSNKKKLKKTEEPPGKQLTLVNPDEEEKIVEEDIKLQEPAEIPPPIKSTPVRPTGWKGPITPDGVPFHDLSNYRVRDDNFPDRALRYVVPDRMHRLPIRQIEDRLRRGDTIIVDLNGLIHMDTQTNACRRTLKHMGDELGIAIFALDETDKLLLLPGMDVTMDVAKNQLGLAPILL